MTARHLVLTGMPGVGKSTVGPLVAELLRLPFVDTDALIESRSGMTIADIFGQHGEAYFRKLEAELCIELCEFPPSVIVSGGGTLLPQANHAMLESVSHIVHLSASLDTLLKRLDYSWNRPILDNRLERRTKLQDLIDQRQTAYQRAMHSVATDLQTPQETAQQVAQLHKIAQEFHLNPHIYVKCPGSPSYPVYVGDGHINRLEAFLENLQLGTERLFVITHPSLIRYFLKTKNAPVFCTFPEGESFKTLDTVESLFKQLMAHGAHRGDTLIAFGGGVVCDVTGFVASTYMRGIPCIYVPTSLLAMVDASVGGKTGVDLEHAKNALGTFSTPRGVLIDPLLLATLSPEELRSGMAELIKHALIGDSELFAELEAGTVDLSASTIKRAIAVKVKIVEEDFFEANNRRFLNLGHTFGHAIETASQFKIRHGEAVSIGLVLACQLSQRLGMCNATLAERVSRLLKRFGLPTALDSVDPSRVIEAMRCDKKRSTGNLRFVLLSDMGQLSCVDVAECALDYLHENHQ